MVKTSITAYENPLIVLMTTDSNGNLSRKNVYFWFVNTIITPLYILLI